MVGGPVGLEGETKKVVQWLTASTENVDDGMSPHSGSINTKVAAALLDLSGARGSPGGVGGPRGLVAQIENVVLWPQWFAEIDDNGGNGGLRGPVAQTENVVPQVLLFPEIVDGLSQHSGSDQDD